ncbi:MAG: hypothetical protein D6753_08005 [Planctomycetota bacterium]|nr:MAG: hypothetical protein D6753_08005 [Planctomycetota bacterium]
MANANNAPVAQGGPSRSLTGAWQWQNLRGAAIWMRRAPKLGVGILIAILASTNGGCSPVESGSADVNAQPTPTVAQRREIRILSWNLGTLPPRGAIELMHYKMPEFDILAVSDVPHDDVLNVAFEFFGRDNSLYSSHEGETDNLILAWSDRFQPRELMELREVDGRPLRADWGQVPIGARLYDTITGCEFIVLHLHCPDDGCFNAAGPLNRWVESQPVPVFVVGTLHANIDVETGQGGAALAQWTGPQANLDWIRPTTLVDSGWDDADGDGVDDASGFVQHVALRSRSNRWTVRCEFVSDIVTRPSRFASVQAPLLTRIEPPSAE